MQFRKYVELRRAMFSGDAWSRAHDKLGANVWDGALSSKDTLSFVVQWYRELLLRIRLGRCIEFRGHVDLRSMAWGVALR
jgi:hypothetical protein